MLAARSVTIPPEHSTHCGVHIVIAEDNAITRRKIELAVSQLDWTFDSAVDGLEALVAVEGTAHNLCLLLADIDMPRMTGIELAKILKSIPSLARVPVVLMGWPHQESEAREAKCDAFIAKPFSIDILLDCLESLA